MSISRRDRIGIGLLAAVLCLSGCYGPFNLTRRVYHWNARVGDKWEREFAFIVLAWVPVYSVAVLADGIVFNSIEFWNGKNPVEPPRAGITSPARTQRISRAAFDALLTRADEGDTRVMTVELFQGGQAIGSARFEHRPGEPTVARDAEGRTLFSAQAQPDGGVVVTDARDARVAVYTADQVERMLRSGR